MRAVKVVLVGILPKILDTNRVQVETQAARGSLVDCHGLPVAPHASTTYFPVRCALVVHGFIL